MKNQLEAAFIDRVAQYEKAGLLSKNQARDLNRRLETEQVESLSDELGSMLRRTPSNSKQDDNNAATSTMKIWEPLDWGEHIGNDETTIDAIFAEMCLFARLGHHQPPCCLPCGYYKRSNNTQCNGWVVWRKDAQRLLHPDSIGENIVILTCCGARRLLNGGVVDGRRWDIEEKQLVRSASS